MSKEPQGRVAPSPPPPFLKGTSDSFVGAYPWNNVTKEAIGRDRHLTRAELRQVQGVLNRIDRLPFFLQTLFTSRYNFIRRKKSPLGGLYFLKNTFERKLLPRLERVNELCGINETASIGFLSARDEYARLPTMGAYRELRKLPRGVSIACEFDDRVRAARAAADEGDFERYIIAQGGANMPRDAQAVRVARKVTDEVNEDEEDIERVVGIYAPHLGAHRVHVTRTAEWRIVPKILAVEPLTLKSGSAAPRSPVNNCGKLAGGGDPVMTPTPTEQAAAVLNLIERGVTGWNEPDVVKGLHGALKASAPRRNRQQIKNVPLKTSEQAPSARMTKLERGRMAQIRFDLAQEGITPERWELDALSRGATVIYGDRKFSYPDSDEWLGF